MNKYKVSADIRVYLKTFLLMSYIHYKLSMLGLILTTTVGILPKFLRYSWLLSSECQWFVEARRATAQWFNATLRCPVDGVRCCRIALLGQNSLSYWGTLLYFIAKTFRSFVPTSRNNMYTCRNSIHYSLLFRTFFGNLKKFGLWPKKK